MSSKLRHDVTANQKGKGQISFVKFTRGFLMRFHGQKVLADRALQDRYMTRSTRLPDRYMTIHRPLHYRYVAVT